MIELSEERFEKLIMSAEGDYLSYLDLFYMEGERIVARFAGNNTVVLFTNMRIIQFFFPLEENKNKAFREYKFTPYRSVKSYLIMASNKNIIITFNIFLGDKTELEFTSISQNTIFELTNIINQYTI